MTTVDADAELIAAAVAARHAAYAPYSHFLVGAAVRAASGKIYTGVNVENRSYGLTVCAERNAIAHAVGAGERAFVAIAIASGSSPPAPPCGACREVMAEFNAAMNIHLSGGKGETTQTTLSALLPMPFVFKGPSA